MNKILLLFICVSCSFAIPDFESLSQGEPKPNPVKNSLQEILKSIGLPFDPISIHSMKETSPESYLILESQFRQALSSTPFSQASTLATTFNLVEFLKQKLSFEEMPPLMQTENMIEQVISFQASLPPQIHTSPVVNDLPRPLRKKLRSLAYTKKGFYQSPEREASVPLQETLNQLREHRLNLIQASPPAEPPHKIFFHFNKPPSSNGLDFYLLRCLDRVRYSPNPSLRAHVYQLNEASLRDKFIEIARLIGPEKVQIILDAEYLEEDKPDPLGPSYWEVYQALKAAGINVRTDKTDGMAGSGESHNKYAIVNQEWVWTGSVNWTRNCLRQNYNHGMEFRSSEMAAIYNSEFEQALKGRMQKGKWDSVQKHEVKIDGTRIEIYFSPQDGLTDVLADQLQRANQEILLAMFFLSEKSLLNTMILQKKRGIQLKIKMDNLSVGALMEKIGEERVSVGQYLTAQGIPFEKDSGAQMFHHKFALIDALSDSDPVLITGSHNWTKGADENNDENTLIIHDTAIVRQFRAEYEILYGASIPRTEVLSDLQSPVKIEQLKIVGEDLQIQVGKGDYHLLAGGNPVLDFTETSVARTYLITGAAVRPKDQVLVLRGAKDWDAVVLGNGDGKLSRSTYLKLRPLVFGRQWQECKVDETIDETCTLPWQSLQEHLCLARQSDFNKAADFGPCQ